MCRVILSSYVLSCYPFITPQSHTYHRLIEADDDNKDDSDSDFTENDIDDGPYQMNDVRSYSKDSLSVKTRTQNQLYLNSIESLSNLENNILSPRESENIIKNENKTSGILEEIINSHQIPIKNKKELKKKPDLPPLGKTFTSIVSQHSTLNLLNNSCSSVNLQLLSPLIVSGASSSSSASNIATLYGAQIPGARDFNILETVLPLPSSSYGMPDPGSAGRDNETEWTRQVSPVTSLNSEGFNRKIKDDNSLSNLNSNSNSNLNSNSNFNSVFSSNNVNKKSFSQDNSISENSKMSNNVVNNKYNNIIFSEDHKDKDKNKVSKDLKDLIVIDGIEKRNLINSYLTTQRKSIGNIVTGHSLLGSMNLSSSKNFNEILQSNISVNGSSNYYYNNSNNNSNTGSSIIHNNDFDNQNNRNNNNNCIDTNKNHNNDLNNSYDNSMNIAGMTITSGNDSTYIKKASSSYMYTSNINSLPGNDDNYDNSNDADNNDANNYDNNDSNNDNSNTNLSLAKSLSNVSNYLNIDSKCIEIVNNGPKTDDHKSQKKNKGKPLSKNTRSNRYKFDQNFVNSIF